MFKCLLFDDFESSLLQKLILFDDFDSMLLSSLSLNMGGNVKIFAALLFTICKIMFHFVRAKSKKNLSHEIKSSMLCIFTCFRVLRAPESWSNYFCGPSSTLFVDFRCFLVKHFVRKQEKCLYLDEKLLKNV